MQLPFLAARATRVFVIAALSAAFVSSVAAQRIDYSQLEIKTTDLGNGVHILNWQGGDSLILVGDEGVLLVDTSVAAMGEKIGAAIAKVTDKPIKFIINTHAHADHFGANEALAKDGAVIVGHATLRDRMANGFTAFGPAIPPAGWAMAGTAASTMTRNAGKRLCARRDIVAPIRAVTGAAMRRALRSPLRVETRQRPPRADSHDAGFSGAWSGDYEGITRDTTEALLP